jgi:hypothetical protein
VNFKRKEGRKEGDSRVEEEIPALTWRRRRWRSGRLAGLCPVQAAVLAVAGEDASVRGRVEW